MYSDEEKKVIIEKWLREEGFQVSEAPDSGSTFNFSVDAGGIRLHVIQNPDQQDKILIISGVDIPLEIENKLSSMSLERKRAFLWSLRFGLLQLRVSSSPVALPLKLKVVNAAYYDGLNKNLFMERLLDVHRAIVCINWNIERALGEPGPVPDLSYIG
ncbi:MAG: DUF2299 domain-containing protein [Methanosarcinales archaeon]|nr:DUF2299 domain-containing protein [Methanosarcinales archaeon]